MTPSRLSADQQGAIARCASDAARALGLVHGPIHAEFRVNDEGVWPLEIAPRPIGGLCARALRFGPDLISLEELLVRHALGMPGSDLEREQAASGVMMIPVPANGVLENAWMVSRKRSSNSGRHLNRNHSADKGRDRFMAGRFELSGIYFRARRETG